MNWQTGGLMKGGKTKSAAKGPVRGPRGSRAGSAGSGKGAQGREWPVALEDDDIAGAEDGLDGHVAGDEGEVPASAEGPERPARFKESEKRILELLDKERALCAPETKKKAMDRMRPEKFRVLDHTADVGIQAFGENLCEAFENAALGMFNIITDPSRVGAQKDFEVTVEGADLKDLLHEWLDQLLILSQVQNMLFSSFKVDLRDIEGGFCLTGLVMGEPADPSRHVYKTEIKAVTHHMLEVRSDPPMVKVIFDI